MSPLVQVLCVIGLGLFWGLSPPFYRLMGDAGIPITHIIVLSGLGVGIGLWVVRALVERRLAIGWRAMAYGLGCGILMNVPFAFSLFVILKIPVPVYGVAVATAPLWSYALAIVLRREQAHPIRLAALGVGFLSSVVLIVTRAGSGSGPGLDAWALAAFVSPFLYAFYNHFAAVAWPKGMDTMTAGTVESLASALLVLPVMAILDWPKGTADFHSGYWLLVAITVVWLIERIAFFTMIRHAGPVTTVQAVYVSTPAAVGFGALLVGDQLDRWIFVSLALLLGALWLNNLALARPRLPAAAIEAGGNPRGVSE
ncbi:MAG: DMT family transporter [Hyphomicrobiaceae bacterium]